jgi:Ala-tRNA(Pro) deacylase
MAIHPLEATPMYLVDYLRSHRVWFKTLLHPPTSSAAKLASSLHVPGRAVAKTVLVNAGGEYVLTVLPATSRIDMNRLAVALNRDPGAIRLATADEIARFFPNCEPGAIPPFGRLYGVATVLDAALADQAEIVFGANTRHEGMRMRFADYETVEAPMRASFAVPIDARAEVVVRPRRAG